MAGDGKKWKTGSMEAVFAAQTWIRRRSPEESAAREAQTASARITGWKPTEPENASNRIHSGLPHVRAQLVSLA
jgi:hypothetical protein